MKIDTIRVAALAAAAVMGIALAAPSHAAAVNSVTSCRGSSKASVIGCCEKVVLRKGVPRWMARGGQSCSSAAVCTGGGHSGPATLAAKPKKPVCYIKKPSSVTHVDDMGSGAKAGTKGSKAPGRK